MTPPSFSLQESIITVSLGEPGESTVHVESKALETLTEDDFSQSLTKTLVDAASSLCAQSEMYEKSDLTPVIDEDEYSSMFAEVSVFLPKDSAPMVTVLFGGLASRDVPQRVSLREVSERIIHVSELMVNLPDLGKN